MAKFLIYLGLYFCFLMQNSQTGNLVQKLLQFLVNISHNCIFEINIYFLKPFCVKFYRVFHNFKNSKILASFTLLVGPEAWSKNDFWNSTGLTQCSMSLFVRTVLNYYTKNMVFLIKRADIKTTTQKQC